MLVISIALRAMVNLIHRSIRPKVLLLCPAWDGMIQKGGMEPWGGTKGHFLPDEHPLSYTMRSLLRFLASSFLPPFLSPFSPLVAFAFWVCRDFCQPLASCQLLLAGSMGGLIFAVRVRKKGKKGKTRNEGGQVPHGSVGML